jgi:hypothetical protein
MPSSLDGAQHLLVSHLVAFDLDSWHHFFYLNIIIHFEGGSVSQQLLKANVTIQDNSVCTRQYGSEFYGYAMLCASAPGKDTCQVRFLF